MTQGGNWALQLQAVSFGASNGMWPLDQIVFAIGRSDFSDVLHEGLRSTVGIDHIKIFALTDGESPKFLLCQGHLDPSHAAALADAYVRGYHVADPNQSILRRNRNRRAPFPLPFVGLDAYEDRYRRLFFDQPGFVDKWAMAYWAGETCYYVKLFRRTEFTTAETVAMATFVPTVTAAVVKHFELEMGEPSPKDRFQPEPLSTTTTVPRLNDIYQTIPWHMPPLCHLTEQQRRVCAGILAGQSSEAIGLDLGKKVNTVLTHRRLAYERLRISSQAQLFQMIAKLR
jgi:DNA-binding CsgD family transcriptional regulator